MTQFIKISGLFAFLFLVMASFTVGKGDVKEVKILTSAQCDMCKEKIEHHIKFEKGVKTVSLDVESKMAIITFDEKKGGEGGAEAGVFYVLNAASFLY